LLLSSLLSLLASSLFLRLSLCGLLLLLRQRLLCCLLSLLLLELTQLSLCSFIPLIGLSL
jgi:hypothetical protein